jgi:hypothetical protein
VVDRSFVHRCHEVLDRQVFDRDVACVLCERVLVLALSVENRARSTDVGRVVTRDDLVVLTGAEGVKGVGAAVVVVGGATVGVGSLVVVDVAAGSVGEALSVGEAVSAGVGDAVSVGEALSAGAGEAVGVGAPLLAIVKLARRREVVPSDQVSTTLMVCDPSASLLVSYGRAVPSAAVPAKSKGAAFSVRTGAFLCHEPSR